MCWKHIPLRCAYCHRQFSASRRRVCLWLTADKQQRLPFCSHTCFVNFGGRRKNIICPYCQTKVHRFPLACCRPRLYTALELFGYYLLWYMKLKAIHQYFIDGWRQVDAYISHLNLIVQFDGDYWHADPWQRELDQRHDKLMQERGYRLVRIWEHELCQNYQLLRDRIITVCTLDPDQLIQLPSGLPNPEDVTILEQGWYQGSFPFPSLHADPFLSQRDAEDFLL
jgi:very-short-patch-repair endonuclease/uncharacterized Zn-finger protein